MTDPNTMHVAVCVCTGPTYADVLVGNFVPSTATTPDTPSTGMWLTCLRDPFRLTLTLITIFTTSQTARLALYQPCAGVRGRYKLMLAFAFRAPTP